MTIHNSPSTYELATPQADMQRRPRAMAAEDPVGLCYATLPQNTCTYKVLFINGR